MIKNNVFVLGLDGASWKVLDPLIKKGKMPFLKLIIENGSSGVLESVFPPITAPAWTSFQTGVNPGKHGVFEFLDYRVNPKNPPIVSALSIKRKKVWDYIKDYGKSLVINMPVSYPPGNINGILISSFLTPPGEKYIYPIKYLKILKRNKYKIDALYRDDNPINEKELFDSNSNYAIEVCLDIAKKRIETFKELYEKDKFNFNFLLIKETDVAQHTYWGTEKLNIFYEKLDPLINDLYKYYLNKTKGKGNFIIVSDHGFHKASGTEFSPYYFLKKNGYIFDDPNFNLLWKLLKISKNIIKNFTIYKNFGDKENLIKNRLLKKGKNQLIDKTKYIVAAEGLYIIGEMKDKDKIVKRIIRELSNIKHNGKKVFYKVGKSSEFYYGENMYLAPDIVWIPSEDFSLNLSPFSDSLITKRKLPYLGTHLCDRNGIFIAIGKDIRRRIKKDLSITDILPLTLNLLKISIPNDIDGEVPYEILNIQNSNIKEVEKIKKNINKEISELYA